MKLTIRTQIDDGLHEIVACSFPLDLNVGTIRDQIRVASDHVYETLARNYLHQTIESRRDREADHSG